LERPLTISSGSGLVPAQPGGTTLRSIGKNILCFEKSKNGKLAGQVFAGLFAVF